MSQIAIAPEKEPEITAIAGASGVRADAVMCLVVDGSTSGQRARTLPVRLLVI